MTGLFSFARRTGIVAALAAVALCTVATLSHAAVETIYSNNASPGDFFTNAGPVNSGLLVGTTNWLYNNVRNSGTVGINTNLPRSGNGSVSFAGTQGPGGASSKADIEYYNVVSGALTSMGTLGNITTLAYEWYKNSASVASQHASLRILVDADGNLGTATDRGYLVYERAYQTDSSVPTDQWNSDSLMSANLWQVWFGNGTFDTAGNFQPLSVWGSVAGFTPSGGGINMNANSIVYGLSSGIGSGWAAYSGAVDNIAIGFGTAEATTYNFEVPGAAAVPEMGALITWGMLLMSTGMAYCRRR